MRPGNFFKRMLKRSVCVHFHIFKNAGSTVDWAFERKLGRAFRTVDGDGPGDRLGPTAVERFLQKHPATRYLSSHQFRFPLPEMKRIEFLPILFIRHPIDRALSIYAFEKRQGGITPGSRKAEQTTLADYTRWRLDQGAVAVLADFQTSVLSFEAGEDPGRQIERADVERAERNLAACTVVGVVERLDESLVWAEYVLEPHFKNVDLAYIPQNVTQGRPATIGGRLKRARATLDAPLMDELTERNQNDTHLHLKANELLDTRLRSIPDLARRLADFKIRCAQLAASVSITTQ